MKKLVWKSMRDCVHFTACNRFVIHPVGLNWGNNGRAQYDSVVMYDYFDIKKPVSRKFASVKHAKLFASTLSEVQQLVEDTKEVLAELRSKKALIISCEEVSGVAS